jgi:hypothetical protein
MALQSCLCSQLQGWHGCICKYLCCINALFHAYNLVGMKYSSKGTVSFLFPLFIAILELAFLIVLYGPGQFCVVHYLLLLLVNQVFLSFFYKRCVFQNYP